MKQEQLLFVWNKVHKLTLVVQFIRIIVKLYILNIIISYVEELKKLVESVEASEEFKEVKDSVYLCSLFSIMENDKGEWQVDYYNHKEDKMVSFVVNDKVSREESKIFKEKESKVDRLEIDKVKIDLKEAFKIANKLHKDKYNSETVNKKIVILQVVKKPIWNLTYLTAAFNIINFKIDAVSGEIISDNKSSALSLGSKK